MTSKGIESATFNTLEFVGFRDSEQQEVHHV
jgi:hypothetical protein